MCDTPRFDPDHIADNLSAGQSVSYEYMVQTARHGLSVSNRALDGIREQYKDSKFLLTDKQLSQINRAKKLIADVFDELKGVEKNENNSTQDGNP